MSSSQIEAYNSVLVRNTEENFKTVLKLLHLDTSEARHTDFEPFIRCDVLTKQAFYSQGSTEQPIISIELLMQLWMLPTYEAKVVFSIENIVLHDNHPWKKIYEQILRDSL